MKKILLTGGAGYIGSHVCNLLIDKNYKVTVIDNLETGNKFLIPKRAKFELCDIGNTKKIEQILKKENFDIIMHFAGLIRVDESVKKPKKYILYNYEKSKKFLEICFKHGLNKVIFSSTAAVYGNLKNKKAKETDKLSPLNPYALSKMKLENYLIKKSKIDKINYVILRYFNVAGAEKKLRTGLVSKHASHLIKIICEVVTNKRKLLTINGENYNTKDGTPIRDYIHISDLSDAHLISAEYLLNKGNSQIFNCGYSKGYSVKQVIFEMEKILKRKLPSKIGKRRKGDSERVVANISKFKKYFSWQPKYNNLNLILKSALAWEKKLKKYE